MKVRFQADSDFNQIIIRAVLRREPSIDILTPHAAGLHGQEDLLLIWACTEPQEWINRL
jgi:hypothetical protein